MSIAARRRLQDALAFLPARAALDGAERWAIGADLFCDEVGELVPYVLRLIALTFLSTVIAALGLIGNAPAVVIGAMLVAPLMQPILALAAALTNGQPQRELVSLLLILLCTGVGMGVAALVAFVVPGFRAVTITPEMLARTSPGLLDLGIAVAAGAAGAYVTIRRRSVAALPGAAIAVALVPPLTTSGILLERGNLRLAVGAFFLFLANLVGILVAAVIVFLVTGFAGRSDASVWRRRVAIVVPLVVALAIAYPLGRHSAHAFSLTNDEARVRRALVPVLQANRLGLQNLSVIRSDGRLIASVDVVGPRRPPPAEKLVAQLADDLDRRDLTLIVRWTQRIEDQATVR